MSPTCAASLLDEASYAKGGLSVLAAATRRRPRSRQLSALKCTDDGIAIADLAARRVYRYAPRFILPMCAS